MRSTEQRTVEPFELIDRRFHLLADAMPVCISYIDVSHRYQYTNATYERWFGVKRHEAVGKSMCEVLGDEAYRKIKPYVEAALSGEAVHFESAVPYKSGTRFVDARYIPDRDPTDGRVLGFYVLVTDIGDRIALQRDAADAAVTEQRRLAQALHDDVAQRAAAIGMIAGTLKNRIGAIDQNAATQLKMLLEQSRELHNRLRQVSRSLMPVDAEAGGLREALSELAQLTDHPPQARCRLDVVGGDAQIDTAVATELCRIAQQAVQNAVTHGQAQHITIHLHTNGNSLELAVHDDGVGFDTTHVRPGVGLRSMRSRASWIGAELAIESGIGEGTEVSCTLEHKSMAEVS